MEANAKRGGLAPERRRRWNGPVDRLVARIVSGGQTGADQGALEAAMRLEVPCGGWCPEGRRSEKGEIPARFPLRELPGAGYLRRTEMNVVDSDATLVLAYGEPRSGSRKTVEFARRHGRPCYCADLGKGSDSELVPDILAWLEGIGPGLVLNVAGSRESGRPGIQRRAEGLVRLLLQSGALP